MNVARYLVLVVAVSACVLLNHQISADDDTSTNAVDPKLCDDLEKQGKVVIEKCDIENVVRTNDTDKIVDAFRCIWTILGEIEVVKTAVTSCEKKYPEDKGVSLCDLKIIICTFKKVDQSCPALKDDVKKGELTEHSTVEPVE